MTTPAREPGPPSPAAGFDFPATGTHWETADAHSSGWNTGALEQLVEYASGHNSQALMVLEGGRIVLERYFDGFTATSARDVASCQKSVTSFLFGCAISQGLLSIDDPLTRFLGRGWSRASAGEEDCILVRHLLTMTSGLDQRLRRVAAPGTTWQYNTVVYQLGLRVLAAASKTPIEAYTQHTLGSRIGWQQAYYRPRPRMPMPGGDAMLGLELSARDAARFGLLALAGGRWDGHELMPDRKYWQDSLSTSQPMNPGYGYLWWLNGKAAYRAPGQDPPLVHGQLIPPAPPDLFAAMGAFDNRIYVVPSRRLVVVRLGNLAGARPSLAISEFDGAFWGLLARALPG